MDSQVCETVPVGSSTLPPKIAIHFFVPSCQCTVPPAVITGNPVSESYVVVELASAELRLRSSNTRHKRPRNIFKTITSGCKGSHLTSPCFSRVFMSAMESGGVLLRHCQSRFPSAVRASFGFWMVDPGDSAVYTHAHNSSELLSELC
jgi:hypothetical protein